MSKQSILTVLVTVAGFGLLLAAAAAAQPRQGGDVWERLAGRFDANGDGQITEQEFSAGAFAVLDADGDGVLTATDVAERGERMRHRRRGMAGAAAGPGGFGAMIVARLADEDDDRAVTRGEWDRFSDLLDADGDGTIAAEEWASVLPERPGHGRPGAGPCGAGCADAAERQRSGRLARGLDRDGDGAVETDDLATLFDELDADEDGILASEEIFRHRGGR